MRGKDDTLLIILILAFIFGVTSIIPVPNFVMPVNKIKVKGQLLVDKLNAVPNVIKR